MCLAVPVQVKTVIDHNTAIVNMNGVNREISLHLVSDIQPGDYVIVHVGFALSKLNEREAKKTLQLLDRANIEVNTEQ